MGTVKKLRLAHRIAGSNQYEIRYTSDQSAVVLTTKTGLTATRTPDHKTYRCGEIWDTNCTELIGPPLWRHGRHPDLETQKQAARTSSNPVVLKVLGHGRHVGVAQRTAGNQACSTALLRYLSRNPHWRVRRQVILNPNCRTDLLNQLSQDTDIRVRRVALQVLHPDRTDTLHTARHPQIWDPNPARPALLRAL
jgi:hypothetical protein